MACLRTAVTTAVEQSSGLVGTDMAGQMRGRHDRCTFPRQPHQRGKEIWGNS